MSAKITPLHALSKMPEAVETQPWNLREQLEAARDEMGKPFPMEAELKEKSARLAELDAEMAVTLHVQTVDQLKAIKMTKHDPMTPSTFTWRFKLILKKNGLPERLKVHSLKHSTASLLIANGTDVATVAGLLGHSQPSTTLDFYIHAFDKSKKVASEALQQSLEI